MDGWEDFSPLNNPCRELMDGWEDSIKYSCLKLIRLAYDTFIMKLYRYCYVFCELKHLISFTCEVQNLIPNIYGWSINLFRWYWWIKLVSFFNIQPVVLVCTVYFLSLSILIAAIPFTTKRGLYPYLWKYAH